MAASKKGASRVPGFGIRGGIFTILNRGVLKFIKVGGGGGGGATGIIGPGEPGVFPVTFGLGFPRGVSKSSSSSEIGVGVCTDQPFSFSVGTGSLSIWGGFELALPLLFFNGIPGTEPAL